MKDVSIFSANSVLILILFLAKAMAIDNCSTPDNLRGKCVKLSECRSLRDMARNSPVSDTDRIFLRQSQCDAVENYPWVCCPLDEVSFPTRNSKSASRKPPQIIHVEDSSQLLNPKICGRVAHNLDDRIFGGSETTIGEFPWMTLLVYETKNQKLSFGCGGVLITNKHVLTAAHCVIRELLPFSWKLTKVRLGEWDRGMSPDCQEIDRVTVCSPDPIDMKITKITAHAKYNHANPDKVNDIAMLRLESSVAYTEFVRPICLPLDTSLSNQNSYATFGAATVTGFGKTENASVSKRMLKVELDIVDHMTCKSKYRVQGRVIHDSQICAIKYHADTCNGDSGSPFMRQSDSNPSFWYLVGITSFGPSKCGATDYPGIYTNVENYIDWIKATIKL